MLIRTTTYKKKNNPDHNIFLLDLFSSHRVSGAHFNLKLKADHLSYSKEAEMIVKVEEENVPPRVCKGA